VIDKFDQVKAQLSELAPIINGFTSEAVQLRIVDLIFGQRTDEDGSLDEELDSSSAPRPSKRKARRKTADKAAGADQPAVKPRGSSGRPSAASTLDRLITDGFFKQRKGLGDIVTYSSTTLALQYKLSDFSPTLVRAVRDGKLKRTKNDTGQYEYENA